MTDIILDNYGPMNLSIIFVWFSIFISLLFYVYPLVFEPKRFYYFVFIGALLMITRSIFITLTHLQSPFDQVQADWPSWAGFIVFSNDLFFSGHTSFPFLGFLMSKKPLIKYFMLLSSIIIGWSALLMHQHYSIDVFAAFFITYGVYKIGNRIIRKFERNRSK
jgi:hypothetical protein